MYEFSKAYWYGNANISANNGLDFVQHSGVQLSYEINKLVKALREMAVQANQARHQANEEHNLFIINVVFGTVTLFFPSPSSS